MMSQLSRNFNTAHRIPLATGLNFAICNSEEEAADRVSEDVIAFCVKQCDCQLVVTLNNTSCTQIILALKEKNKLLSLRYIISC